MIGKFILIEGIDTAGKSTQAKLLAEKLRLDGYKVKIVHFPMYEEPIGELINRFLNGEVDIDIKAVQFLYVADQMNARNQIENFLEEGYIVISDRYDLSTCVYYGSVADGIDGFNYMYNNVQSRLLRPDLTFVIDIPVNEISKRKSNLDVFERNIEGMIKKRDLYLHSVVNLDNRVIYKINGTDTIENIENYIYKEVKNNIERR